MAELLPNKNNVRSSLFSTAMYKENGFLKPNTATSVYHSRARKAQAREVL